MCKRIIKIINKHIVFFLTLIIMADVSFASNVILPNGRGFIIGSGPFDNEIVLAGDSYAEHFYNDEKGRGINFYTYYAQGTTLEENKERLMEAFNSFHRVIVLSVSVNDQIKETHPAIFEKNYRELLDKSVETEKIVIVHTYIHYPAASFADFSFPTYAYDSIVRKLAAEYPNVHYVDMSDCEDTAFSTGDGIHYSKIFNDILFDRIKKKIEGIFNK